MLPSVAVFEGFLKILCFKVIMSLKVFYFEAVLSYTLGIEPSIGSESEQIIYKGDMNYEMGLQSLRLGI